MFKTKKEEERDFKRRMNAGAKSKKARADHDKAEKKRLAAISKIISAPTHRTGRFKVAKAFKAGHGRYS